MAQIALNKPSGGQLLIQPEDGTSTETVTIPSVGVGKVLQVAGTRATDGFTLTTTSYMEGPNLAIDFTPQKADSKILFMVSFGVHVDNSGNYLMGHVRQDGTVVSGFTDAEIIGYTSGSGAGSHGETVTFQVLLDAGSTATRRYAYYIRSATGGNIYCYRHKTVTVMEVAA